MKKIFSENQNSFKYFVLGPVQIVLSSFCFALMSLFAKMAMNYIPSTEVTFFRLIIGAVVSIIVIFATGTRLINDNAKTLIVRGFFGGLAVILFFLAIENGTITNSVVLQNTYPIFAAIIALHTLKEKLNIKLIACLLVTFAGILLLSRPNFGSIRIGDVFGLASGFLGALAITAVRKLRINQESVWTIFFYFCIFGAVMSFIMAVPQWKWPNANEWLLLILTGIIGLLGQVTMTAAYKYCTATIGGILSMSTSVFTFVLGVLFLRESFALIDVAAIFLIIAGNVLVVSNKQKKSISIEENDKTNERCTIDP